MERRPVDVTVDRRTPVHIHVLRGKRDERQGQSGAKVVPAGHRKEVGFQEERHATKTTSKSLRQGDHPLPFASHSGTARDSMALLDAVAQAKHCERKIDNIMSTMDEMK
jgi:hypothetical protein